ncbi:MBL fold metallo-hydrolase [Phenylobacterium sp.]|uniref:MBL fold metallo-hydrolase n=1 Tax=Phenylobacterium sp. TaxID=1871053 RepID=UPI00286A3836|nr:MBL fold metallo-hydrolase [Phenylobacterium sp.]
MRLAIAIAFALAASLAVAAAPAAAESADVHRFKIGALDAVSVRDGGLNVAIDGKTFGIGRPAGEVGQVLTAANLATEAVDLSIQPLLVRGAGKVLLFDTGAGNVSWAKGGRLQASLSAAGVTPDQVTDIFISHSHGDHIGGLLGADGALAFPKATVHLSEPEWASMQAARLQKPLVAALTPKVVTFKPGAVVLPGLVTAVAVNGHTAGHSAYEIGTGKARVLFIGDTAHHFVISVRKPDWTISYDGDAPTAQASRRALLQRAADQKLRLYSPHFPFPGVGSVRAEGDGFVWVPEAR